MRQLNDTPVWREIVGRPLPDQRLRDVELILRFLALYKRADAYEKPMKTFLTDFIRRHREGDLNEELRPLFLRVSREVRDHLGPKPFNFRSGLNAAVFDAVFVAFARNAGPLPTDIQERYKRLLADEEFQKSTSRATTDVEAVRRRIALTSEYLFK